MKKFLLLAKLWDQQINFLLCEKIKGKLYAKTIYHSFILLSFSNSSEDEDKEMKYFFKKEIMLRFLFFETKFASAAVYVVSKLWKARVENDTKISIFYEHSRKSP
jgi:hypothetical protein